MTRRDLHGGCLEAKKPGSEGFRDAELDEAFAGVLTQVIGDLDVNVIGRNSRFARPALIDHLDEVTGDVEAPEIVPSFLKPSGEFVAGVTVHYIDIEFALLLKTSPGQIAASEKADLRINRIGAEEKVELGVKRMAEKKFDYDLLCADLGGELAKPLFVFVRWGTECQLVAEFLGHARFQAGGGLKVEASGGMGKAQGVAQFVLGKALHAD